MKAITIVCAALILTAGCASQSKRINSTGLEIDNLRRDIRFLKQQNSQMLRELDSLQKRFAEMDQSHRQVKADLTSRIDELTGQIERVQSGIKDTNYRISGYGPRAPLADKSSAPMTDKEAETDTLRGLASPQALAVNQSRGLYNTAYRDLSRGNYQLALQGFRQYVNDYPNSDLTDNAQYWIGEVFYAQGRYQNAIDEFEKVVKWYRTGDKTASALLKIGFSYINMEELEQGRVYLQDVIDNYPDSDEASRARGRLEALNKN